MALTNQAKTVMVDMLTGGSAYAHFGVANARIIVGTNSAPAGPSDTVGTFGLANPANYFVKPCSSVVVSGNTITFTASFLQGEANFAWNEWGIVNSAAGGQILNRKVEVLGTKASNEQWNVTVTLDIGA